MRPTVEMQNNGPRNKEMALAVGGDLYVAIIRRKREENKEARVKVDSRAKEEKSEFQGKTEGSGSNNNMGGVSLGLATLLLYQVWSTRTRPNG